MAEKHATAAWLWTRDSLIAIALAGTALAAALGSLYYLDRSQRLAEELKMQTVFAEAFEHRSLACMDRASASLGDAALHERAAKALNISRGITLCLVQYRDQARIAVDGLAGCIKELEAANLVLEPGAGGRPIAHPAC